MELILNLYARTYDVIFLLFNGRFRIFGSYNEYVGMRFKTYIDLFITFYFYFIIYLYLVN